jgi:hypothetical protein
MTGIPAFGWRRPSILGAGVSVAFFGNQQDAIPSTFSRVSLPALVAAILERVMGRAECKHGVVIDDDSLTSEHCPYCEIEKNMTSTNYDERQGCERCAEKDAQIARLREDAERYRYIRKNMEWRRSGDNLADDDSHAFVGCRFPYLANFSCQAMLDYNIDKMIQALLESSDE